MEQDGQHPTEPCGSAPLSCSRNSLHAFPDSCGRQEPNSHLKWELKGLQKQRWRCGGAWCGQWGAVRGRCLRELFSLPRGWLCSLDGEVFLMPM